MIILPAIDIKDGQCVRLLRGEFGTVHKVAESPEISALNFKENGAGFLHIVDLDGALMKRPVNTETVKKIISLGIPVEIGGGIRSEKDFETYAEMGAKRIILGSAAMTDKNLIRQCVEKYPLLTAVGIDAKDGYVATEGWIKTGNVEYTELAKEMESLGVKYIIFTDISKDGTLGGPNLAQLENLKETVDVNIIASGGIRDINDIKACRSLGIYGVICGKSLYSGTLDLREAIECSQKE
jgi:phosphoribosylformimino-5-aminoimidazole carboxamide ribotide isomerase